MSQSDRPSEPTLTAQQRQLLELLRQSDRYRYELLSAADDSYQTLKRLLDPLVADKLVTYHFGEDAQRFAITAKGRDALEPKPQRISWFPQ